MRAGLTGISKCWTARRLEGGEGGVTKDTFDIFLKINGEATAIFLVEVFQTSVGPF